MLDILGLFANATSLLLWIPQAKITYKNRNNREALHGISYGTQTIAAINTILWGGYGIMTRSIWLATGTIVILPLALWTMWLKYKSENDIWYEQNSRTLASKNELIESEATPGYFRFYMGHRAAVDRIGQQTLIKLDSSEKLSAFCQKYRIDAIQFDEHHYDEKQTSSKSYKSINKENNRV